MTPLHPFPGSVLFCKLVVWPSRCTSVVGPVLAPLVIFLHFEYCFKRFFHLFHSIFSKAPALSLSKAPSLSFSSSRFYVTLCCSFSMIASHASLALQSRGHEPSGPQPFRVHSLRNMWWNPDARSLLHSVIILPFTL